MRMKPAALLVTAITAICAHGAAFGATATINQVDTIAVGSLPHVAIGDDGNPLIAYANPNAAGGENLRVMHCATQACGTRTTNDIALTYAIDAIRVAVGPNGLPAVLHRDFHDDGMGGTIVMTMCTDARCAEPARSFTIAEVPVDALATSLGLAVGTDNRPVGTFFGGDGLYVVKCNAEACGKDDVTLTRISSGPSSGFDSDIIAHAPTSAFGGSQGTKGAAPPMIVYADMGADGRGELREVRCGNAACSTIASERVVDAGMWTGWDVAMVGGNAPAWAYFANQTLRVNDNGVITTIDTNGSTGLHNSVRRGNDGGLNIAYYRSADADGALVSDVWFARCPASGCASGVQPVLIDANGSTARPMLAMTSDDLPFFAYIEEDSGQLTIAKCGTRDCR